MNRTAHSVARAAGVASLTADGPFAGHAPRETFEPPADPAAVVTAGDVRFTVLTSRLLRLEWAPGGEFEDRASLVFVNRRLAVPPFTTRTEGGTLIVETDSLTLRYRAGSGKFSADNLEVTYRVGKETRSWRPGTPDTGNLRGTIRTLDRVEGATELEPGLLSRDGWVVVDDSERPLFDSSDWAWVTARPPGERQDIYFFGYGRDFTAALYDFTRVAGRIPMPPRFAFGLWWSRYWGYTDSELMDLVREFEIHGVPLDVLVVDMDWHLTFNFRRDSRATDQAGQRLGWTGYTWDPVYFPEPGSFLAWCREKGLRVPLNLHPASGIQPHEQAYPGMAKAMGIDPDSKKYVPFDIVDKRFAENYLEHVIRPLENQGVDFWWLDWQQWSTTRIPGVTPTWWLNYVFFTDMDRRNGQRPILFHRWGGLGNHRYQIGFSGDVVSGWDSLGFQPFFTATASNVGFGYWSHDIGGHFPGPVPAELYARWIQFGIFSPVLRTHATKDPAAERRIWVFPHDVFMVMRETILLRYALIPYIYTSARVAYDTGVSICRPMYYDHPWADEAYVFDGQYMFGEDLLVAPLAVPRSEDSLVAEKAVWLPEGDWVEWMTGARLTGPAVVTRGYALDEIPVFVKAGSVIPMQPVPEDAARMRASAWGPLMITVFPGPGGEGRVYEDSGDSRGYTRDEYAWTRVTQKKTAAGGSKITIFPTEGAYPGMPETVRYEIRLEGVWPPARVTVDGVPAAAPGAEGETAWRYDGRHLALTIPVDRTDRSEPAVVDVEWKDGAGEAEQPVRGMAGTIRRLRGVMELLNAHWPEEWSPELLVRASQTGHRISLRPETAREEVRQLISVLAGLRGTVMNLRIPEEVRRRVLAHLRDVIPG